MTSIPPVSSPILLFFCLLELALFLYMFQSDRSLSHLFVPFLPILFPLSFYFPPFFHWAAVSLSPFPRPAPWDHAACAFRTNQTHFMATDKGKNRQADKKMESYGP